MPSSAALGAFPVTSTRIILHILDFLLDSVFGSRIGEDLVDNGLFGSLVLSVEFFESVLDGSGLSFA